MNIYFTAAISLKHKYGRQYKLIVNQLLNLGHTVQYKHIVDVSLSDIENNTDKNQRIEYYNKANEWITNADLVVAELSFPSTLNVGHEVTIALQKNIPVIGLFSQGNDSLFFQGITNDNFVYQNYDEENLSVILKESIHYCSDQVDSRFNMMLPNSLNNYLSKISSLHHVSKAGYIRQLIFDDKIKKEKT